jgi:N-methylhydantoinase A
MSAGAPAASWIVGIDAGGTFTDLVAIESRTRTVRVAKVPSTPQRPVEAVAAAAAEAGTADGFERLVHGTTVATNAVLQRAGARVALVTTAGFEDIPHIQRINRPFAFDLGWSKPRALVARRHTVGVRERVGPDGEVIEPLTDGEIERVVAELERLRAEANVEAIALSLLFSYANDAHERRLEAAIARALPELPVSRSSEVSPVWREYERASTTLADAYVRPLMTDYLADLGDAFAERDGRLFLMKSNGGIGTPASIAPAPVVTLHSGLAGGAVAASRFAAAAGFPDAMALDIGGTSTDLGLVRDGSVGQVREFELEWGVPVVSPSVDVRPIGAGGGSIAKVDAGGLLRVGPDSAGARPGPASYGLGGSDATVTDAALVARRLDPSYFAGGRLPLDAAAAEAALGRVAADMGVDAESAAAAVLAVAEQNVAAAIRVLGLERGIEVERLALVAFGGAGPMLVCGVADALGIRDVVVPPHPGLGSALGAACAELRVDRTWSIGARSDRLPEAELAERLAADERAAVAALGLENGDVEVEHRIACRYEMQNYEEEIVIPSLAPGFLDALAAAFHERVAAAYGYAFADEPVELVYGQVSARRPSTARVEEVLSDRDDATEVAGRRVLGSDASWSAATVLRRGRLAGIRPGPLVIEEEDSTTWIPPGWTVEDGPHGVLLARRAA